MTTDDNRTPAQAAGTRPTTYEEVVRVCTLIPPLVGSLVAECAVRGLCPNLGREMLLMVLGSDLRQCGWSPEEVAAKAELGAKCWAAVEEAGRVADGG